METISYKLLDFEGPLDLLLRLITKHKLNIYDISITELLKQYLAQLDLMKENNMEIQSEFLDMASRLIQIKTASLLPQYEEAEEMKKELTGLLIEYQACQTMAKIFSQQINFDNFERTPLEVEYDYTYTGTHTFEELLSAYLVAFGRGRQKEEPLEEKFEPIVSKPIVSVASKIIFVLKLLKKNSIISFNELINYSNNKSEIIATFLAILELIKANRVTIEKNVLQLKTSA